MKERTETIRGCDGYPIEIRRWLPETTADAQLIILHGVVSHSDWLRPIAESLARQNIDVICPDRRGAGLNTGAPGDAKDPSTLIEDVNRIRKYVAKPELALHIAGFCWGATYAICCVEKHPEAFQSLVLIAPSVFPAIDIANRAVVTGETSEATEEPLVPIDRFTSGPAYENYIVPDKLRTRVVSPRFNTAMVRMMTMLAPRWARLLLPSLVILASDDRLANNEKHEKAFNMLKARRKRKVLIHGEHGLQFDAPDETADEISRWLKHDEYCRK